MPYMPQVTSGVTSGPVAGGALGAAGGLGLSALLGPAAFSFLPALIGHFLGDPQAKLRSQIARLLSPENLARLTNQNYQNVIASPGYSQAQGTIAQGANVASNTVAQNLAARGLGTSGTGAILSGLTPSLVGSQQASLRTGAHDLASQQAMQAIQQQIAALMGTQGPSPAQGLFGVGLQSFEPYLRSFLQSRYPSTFNLTPQRAS